MSDNEIYKKSYCFFFYFRVRKPQFPKSVDPLPTRLMSLGAFGNDNNAKFHPFLWTKTVYIISTA